MLFVPVLADKLLAKASSRGADAIILDLEDSIAIERKEEARQALGGALQQIGNEVPTLVRVNSDPDMLSRDIAALSFEHISGVLLPKVESAISVQSVAQALDSHVDRSSCQIMALVETPLALMRLEQIASAHPRLSALGFGAEDYASALGVVPEPTSLMWAAQSVINACRAFGLACFGLPASISELDDMEHFANMARLAKDIGFTGSVAVHPRQVAILNEAFSPNEEMVAWAKQVVKTAEAAAAQGLGTFRLDGRMIDAPVLERAKSVLEQVQRQ